MKFLEQVNFYQKALTKKSRFFSSLMMISGISIVAIAPFLSYEVSKIECQEKGTSSPVIDDNEMIILKNDWKRKENKIVELEKTIQNKEEKIEVLIKDTNCDDVIQVIQIEKEELEEEKDKIEEEKTEIEEEKEECREQLAACKEENERIIKEGNDCGEIQDENKKLIIEITKWKKQFTSCEEEKKKIRNAGSDCGEIQEKYEILLGEKGEWEEEKKKIRNAGSDCGEIQEKYEILLGEKGEWEEEKEKIRNAGSDCGQLEIDLNKCKGQLLESQQTVKNLRGNRLLNGGNSKVTISGTFHHKESFSYNQDQFMVTFNQDDVGAAYRFLHNGKDVTTQLRRSSYTYSDATKKRFKISLKAQLENNMGFVLTSI